MSDPPGEDDLNDELGFEDADDPFPPTTCRIEDYKALLKPRLASLLAAPFVDIGTAIAWLMNRNAKSLAVIDHENDQDRFFGSMGMYGLRDLVRISRWWKGAVPDDDDWPFGTDEELECVRDWIRSSNLHARRLGRALDALIELRERQFRDGNKIAEKIWAAAAAQGVQLVGIRADQNGTCVSTEHDPLPFTFFARAFTFNQRDGLWPDNDMGFVDDGRPVWRYVKMLSQDIEVFRLSTREKASSLEAGGGEVNRSSRFNESAVKRRFEQIVANHPPGRAPPTEDDVWNALKQVSSRTPRRVARALIDAEPRLRRPRGRPTKLAGK